MGACVDADGSTDLDLDELRRFAELRKEQILYLLKKGLRFLAAVSPAQGERIMLQVDVPLLYRPLYRLRDFVAGSFSPRLTPTGYNSPLSKRMTGLMLMPRIVRSTSFPNLPPWDR